MASLSHTNSGLRIVQFFTGEGDDRARHTLRLGRVRESYARRVLGHVDALLLNRSMQQPIPADTLAWIKSLKGKLAERMADVGLIEPRKSEELAKFLDRYIESRTDLKPYSRKNLRQTRDSLVGFFTANCDLREITETGAIGGTGNRRRKMVADAAWMQFDAFDENGLIVASGTRYGNGLWKCYRVKDRLTVICADEREARDQVVKWGAKTINWNDGLK